MGSTAPGLYSCAFIIAACLVHQNGAMFQSSSLNSPPYGYQSSNVPKRGYPSTFGTESSYPGAQPPSYQNNPSQFGSSSGGYPGGPPPPPGEYAGGPPPQQSGYHGGPLPPESGYQNGPPSQQSGYHGGPPPQQSGYPGGPPPAQGGYIGGPPPPQGGYPGEAQPSYAVPSSGYDGGPPPRGGYQPQSVPSQNGYSNGQAPQPTYEIGASQNGPALSSYQSAPPSGGYHEPPPQRGFPPEYRGGSQNTYPGESPRGYAPRSYPPSGGFPSRFPTKRYRGQVQYFTAPPPDPGRELLPPPRRPYIPSGSSRQQQQQQLQQRQRQQQQQAFVPMPSTTTTPLPTSSTTTTGLPTTVAGEIEPPEYEGVTGTGATTTSTTPTPTTTTRPTTPPPTRPYRVHHHRQQVQPNQYPPRNQQAQRNHWQPPEQRYDQINTRHRGYSTYRDYQLYSGNHGTLGYQANAGAFLPQSDLKRQDRFSGAIIIYPNEQPQITIHGQPQQSPWLIVQSSTGGQGYPPQAASHYHHHGGPLTIHPGGIHSVVKALSPPVPTPTTTTISTTTTAPTTKFSGEYEPPDIELPEVTATSTTTTPTPTTTRQQRPPDPPQQAPIVSHRDDQYSHQWNRRQNRWTPSSSFRYRPFSRNIAAPYRVYQSHQIPMFKPSRQSSTSARTASYSLPKRPTAKRGQTQVQRLINVSAVPASSAMPGHVSHQTRKASNIRTNQQNKGPSLPSSQRKIRRPGTGENYQTLLSMLLKQQSVRAGSSKQPSDTKTSPANARYPPPQQQQRHQQRYPQRAYPPQGQQPQRYPPPRYPPRPQPQPQARRRGYPETRPQATHQRYAAQAQPYNQPARAYPQQRPYEPYKPAYQPRQAFREPLRPQRRTYESRAARMPVARPLPQPRQSQPSRPPPAPAKSVRKEVRFHVPNHLIPKPPPTTTTPRPQRRPDPPPRNPPPPPPQQQNYIGNAGLGRYGQQQYRWFPSEQRWSRHNTQTRGKRSVRGRSEGAGLEASQPSGTPETPVLPSSMLGGIGGEHMERQAGPPVHDRPAVTQFELKTMRQKSPLPGSTINSEVPVQAESSLSRTIGQTASEGTAGENARREENMRGVGRVGIQIRKPSLEQSPSQAIMKGIDEAKPIGYGKVEPLDLPFSSVPLKLLDTHSINWHRLATRNSARKDLHGRNEGIVVLSVA